MNEVALFEAKNRLSELIDRVLAGEVITITRRGKAVARLAPADDEAGQRAAAQAIAEVRAVRSGVSLRGLKSRDLMREGRR
jgi:prevent-host-death family protein